MFSKVSLSDTSHQVKTGDRPDVTPFYAEAGGKSVIRNYLWRRFSRKLTIRLDF